MRRTHNNRPGMAELNELLFHMVVLDAGKRLSNMAMIEQELQRIARMQRVLKSAPQSVRTAQSSPAFTWQIDKSAVSDTSKEDRIAAGSGRQVMQMQFAVPIQQLAIPVQQFVPPPFSASPLFSNGYATASLILSSIGVVLPMYFFLDILCSETLKL